jgi:hypothetical protein
MSDAGDLAAERLHIIAQGYSLRPFHGHGTTANAERIRRHLSKRAGVYGVLGVQSVPGVRTNV